jgi:2,5-diketo-D-gluconate reductase A
MGCSLEQNFVTFNDGNSIPAVGLGVFRIPPPDTEQAVTAALRAGYRHIDTAAVYRNERETGRTVADSDVPATNCR